MNYWLDKGIGGFRMDVIDLIGKVPDEGIIANGPKLHDYLQEMHQETLKGRDVMTVGETADATTELAKLYSDPSREELSMVFHFEHVFLDNQPNKSKFDLKELSLIELKKVMSKWQTELGNIGWNSLYWNNHDTPRIVSRWGNDDKYRVESAKLFAILLHLMKGTPYIYQGEEIGMTNRTVNSIEEVADIESRNLFLERIQEGYTEEELLRAINIKGRDNARTPVQWDNTENAGFTSGSPWLPINPNYKEINVKNALQDKNSIFYTYKKLIQIRKENPIVVWGNYELLLPNHPFVYSYTREYKDEKWLVVANINDAAEKISIDVDTAPEKIIINNYSRTKVKLNNIILKPYEAFVVKLKR